MGSWEERYEVERVLGVGAMGKVYLAKDTKLGREVALKTLGNPDDADIAERFEREARAIAELKHPNVVALYDYGGDAAHELYLVMEYVPGQTLYHLTKNQPLHETMALCVGHELALALEHAHEHHVVHRDVKPENVLLHDGRVVLMDFGAVKAIAVEGDRKADATRPIGTPGFMAPEQFSGEGIDERTDVFALGATLYSLTTGDIPYDGGSIEKTYRNLLAGRYEDPRDGRPLLSPDFCQMVARCLAPKQKDRTGSAAQVRREIDALLGERGVSDARDELRDFQENPALTQIKQRERTIERLLRDLKVALKDKDSKQAATIVQRIREVAPVDSRLDDISGVSFDTSVVRAGTSLESFQRGKRRSLALGVVLGASLLGATLAGLMALGVVSVDLSRLGF